ncbi:MAG: urate hydroxylase PuuD, partial [Shinella sp.]|nr:urate hydroxylase PuuD [Shinella sp.]
MEAYILDWANLLLRWLHIITAIAWIGSSFYFVWLDNSLTKPQDPELLQKGVSGELWAVHGGGFYNPQKYLVAPRRLPEHLHWFYWESYSTWMSGFALLVVLYLFNARTYLIDPSVFDWGPAAAVVAALCFLVVGWLVYDVICRIAGTDERADRKVGIAIALYVAAAS